MKLLLDTHTFIWWDSAPHRLTPRVLDICQDPENVLLLSVASVWEMQIKLQLGKLKLGLSFACNTKPELISSQQRINNFDILTVKLEHVLALDKLLPHHKDPFDRLLIAQADVENAFIVSQDPVFAQYPVKLIW